MTGFLWVKTTLFPVRCEICHQNDCFDAMTNYCSRCRAVNESVAKDRPEKEVDIKFVFICEKRFDELEGSDPVRRHCSTCNTIVTNLDRLDKETRTVFLEMAATIGEMPTVKPLCIATTNYSERAKSKSCSKRLPFEDPQPLLGSIVVEDTYVESVNRAVRTPVRVFKIILSLLLIIAAISLIAYGVY
jgi:hypothetical protein